MDLYRPVPSEQPVIDVSKVLEDCPFGRFRIGIVLLCAAVAMIDGFNNQAIAFVAPVIAADWKIDIAQFGLVFGAGLTGLTLGAVLLGMAADRFGRKSILILSMIMFGVLSLATVLIHSFDSLLLLRFATGLGLGGASPIIIALTAEYSPRALRATNVCIMFSGFPLGSTIGGFIAAALVPALGWQSVFYLGGSVALLLVLPIATSLPESAQYLALLPGSRTRLSSILHRIDPNIPATARARFVISEFQVPKASVKYLFLDGRAAATSLLWAASFMVLLVMLFLVNWLPALMQALGLPIGFAIAATSVLNLGGVLGAIVLGRFIDRFDAHTVLAVAFLISAACLVISAFVTTAPAILLGTLFVAGVGIVGGQIGINALASRLYPTTIRSTGIGWVLGVGRIGSILGPVVGGLLLASGLDTGRMFLASAAPTLIAAACIGGLSVVLSAARGKQSFV